MNHINWIVMACIVMWCSGPVNAVAYKSVTVTDGGVVSGTITFTGTPPPPEHFTITKNPDVCGAERDRYAIEVSNEALIHAVVMIKGVEEGKPPSPSVIDIVGEDCTWLPFMSVVMRTGGGRNGSPWMTVLNEDTVIHNPHPFELQPKSRRTLWNVGLPEKGSNTKQRLAVRKGDTVRLECDQHNFMLSWTKVVSNPYWAITAKDGNYVIDQVPPGTYTLVVWHPTLGEQKKEITVPKNGNVKTSFAF